MGRKNNRKTNKLLRAVSSGISCPTGKVTFPSKTEALLALARNTTNDFWWKNSSYTGAVKRVYQCPHCGEWHLTSQKYDKNKVNRNGFKNSRSPD